MSKLREIKKRIGSVNNIAQVTRAMQLVAASRMRKTQDNAERGRDYAHKIKRIILSLTQGSSTREYPLINPKYNSSKETLVILFSPKRGLAGPLVTNLLRHAIKQVENLTIAGETVHLVTIGKKLRDAMRVRGYSIVADFSELPESPTTGDIRPVVKLIEDEYLAQHYGKIIMVYPKFINPLVQNPSSRIILPLDINQLAVYDGDVDDSLGDYMEFAFEPDAATILNELIPSYLETQIYQAFLETIASEYSARMLAMKTASDNAKELKGDLTLEFNKSRQAQVTRELAEIVGGRIGR
jgi:F-type H+-transporting ATPase subunit gamma